MLCARKNNAVYHIKLGLITFIWHLRGPKKAPAFFKILLKNEAKLLILLVIFKKLTYFDKSLK